MDETEDVAAWTGVCDTCGVEFLRPPDSKKSKMFQSCGQCRFNRMPLDLQASMRLMFDAIDRHASGEGSKDAAMEAVNAMWPMLTEHNQKTYGEQHDDL